MIGCEAHGYDSAEDGTVIDLVRAVATLEEARQDAANVVQAMYDALLAVGHDFNPKMSDLDFYGACRRLPEAGGTVGPLPDGTTIQVEPTTKQALFDALPVDDQRALPTWPLPTLAMVLAAWNARHGSAQQANA